MECGALVRIELSVQGGVVRDARYQAYGCPATMGCARALTESARGLSLLEAATLSESDLIEAVPAAAGRVDSAALALDALHGALSQVLASGAALAIPRSALDPQGVLVGMSGGVDSAVAALLLRDQGHRVAGVTLELWSDAATPGERSCCSPETVRRARRVAHSLGIPHITLDLSGLFYEQVVCYFVESYRGGATPNPCAKCNARVRFAAMLGLAERLGLSQVATGHYARMIGEPPALARGVDRSKDQSYVLAEVDPQILRRVLFPLGEMTKPEVRALAAVAGLEGHEAPESQEICFVADDDHRRFLRERLGELPGDVVDSAGRRLGGHRGVYNFTIGQRKGLGLSHPEACFVLRLDARTRQVVVGLESELQTCLMSVGDLTWHRPAPMGGLAAQVRSGGNATPASLRAAEPAEGGVPGKVGFEGDVLNVVFDPPASAVAPGQTAVVYDGETVVVAGTIVRTEPCGTQGPLPEGGRHPMV